jgi:hypothetical protein
MEKFHTFYIIDDKHNATPTTDEREWVRFMTRGNRTVGNTTVNKTRISTVFLGINHGWNLSKAPILFETMIFGGIFDGESQRYTTWESAEKGHEKWVAKIKKEG